jgi:hypothetical protein
MTFRITSLSLGSTDSLLNFLPCTKNDGHISFHGQDGVAATALGITAANRFAGAPNATEFVLGLRP